MVMGPDFSRGVREEDFAEVDELLKAAGQRAKSTARLGGSAAGCCRSWKPSMKYRLGDCLPMFPKPLSLWGSPLSTAASGLARSGRRSSRVPFR